MPLIAARMFATPRSAYLQFKPTTISREDDGRGAIDCGHGSELAENHGHGDGLWVSCGDARPGVLRIELDRGAEGVHRTRQVALLVSPDRLRAVVRTRVVEVVTVGAATVAPDV